MENKYCFILFLLIPFCFSCKKDTTQNVTQPPFNSDQLQWIQNSQNPKYRVVTYTKDSAGNTTSEIDTLQATTSTSTQQGSEIINDEYTIYYYEGQYSFSLDKIPPSYGAVDWFEGEIDMNNEFGFSVALNNSLTYIWNPISIVPDTAMVNGILYTDVYKFSNNTPIYYYKKGIGFLYIKNIYNNIATLIP